MINVVVPDAPCSLPRESRKVVPEERACAPLLGAQHMRRAARLQTATTLRDTAFTTCTCRPCRTVRRLQRLPSHCRYSVSIRNGSESSTKQPWAGQGAFTSAHCRVVSELGSRKHGFLFFGDSKQVTNHRSGWASALIPGLHNGPAHSDVNSAHSLARIGFLRVSANGSTWTYVITLCQYSTYGSEVSTSTHTNTIQACYSNIIHHIASHLSWHNKQSVHDPELHEDAHSNKVPLCGRP